MLRRNTKGDSCIDWQGGLAPTGNFGPADLLLSLSSRARRAAARLQTSNPKKEKHELSRITIDAVRQQLATFLPPHPRGPEAVGPASTRQFLQLHRTEV